MTNFGLIGAGGIGAYHRAAIERQEALGRARLVAIADPTADRLGAVRAEVEARGVRWHLDYREMLRREESLQAVVIATPIPFHDEMARACIGRGVFVNLEKPPVPLFSQLDALITADFSRRVSVGFQMIGSPCMQALKGLIAEGKIGELREIRGAGCWPRPDSYYARARWAGKMTLDGLPVFDGPATNALAHYLHNIMFLAGPGRHEFAIPVEVEGELYRARPMESYDVACLRGRFSSNLEFSIAVTHATEAALPCRVEIRGTSGWARLSNDGAVLETSCGVALDEPENTQQLLDRDYDHLLDVIEGREARFRTSLSDARGYVSATNGMLVSSGTIHGIDPAFVRRYGSEGQAGFDVADLWEAVQETLHSGRLFSEQGLPWATARPAAVSLEAVELARRMAGKMAPVRA